MTTPQLVDDLRRDESLRTRAYPDPRSPRAIAQAEGGSTVGLSGDPWTIGYGHTGPEVVQGLVWSTTQCNIALDADIAHACGLLDSHIPWWRELDDVRQDVLANMVFNMGWSNPAGTHGLATFHHTLQAIQDHDWTVAAAGMLASGWARQVGRRARRLSDQMLTGEHQT
jgi:lysozyme